MSYPEKMGLGAGMGLALSGLGMGTVRSSVTRYFRRNEDTTDSIGIPDEGFSGDFKITMAAYPIVERSHLLSNSTTNTRLFIEANNSKIDFASGGFTTTFQGVIQVNVFSVISFERSAGAMTLSVNGVDFPAILSDADGETFTINSLGGVWGGATSVPNFAGVQADVEFINEAVQTRYYPINDNGHTIRDLVSGQDGTVINGTAGDWGLFTKKPTLWKGENLTVPPWASIDQELLKA
ncbi:MAG: hypothetical protein V7765_21090 [Oleispira sp.]